MALVMMIFCLLIETNSYSESKQQIKIVRRIVGRRGKLLTKGMIAKLQLLLSANGTTLTLTETFIFDFGHLEG